MTALISLLLLAGGFYVLFGATLYGLQGRLIFLPARDMDRTPADFGMPFEEVRRVVEGHQTFGWYVPLDQHRGAVLFSHGNAGDLSGRIESIQLLRSFGFSVLAYDYGGYGFSTGTPSETRCYADVRAMWDFLAQEKGLPADEILLFGRSLGAAPTVELATTVTPAAVILESAFLSTADMAREIPLFRTLTWLIRHKFENKHKVGEIRAPVLIIHSPNDEVVPFAHGTALFEYAREPKTFLEIRGPHNTGFVESMDLYQPAWERFLTPIFGPNPCGTPAPR